MKILFISSTSLNDIITLNIFYTNFLKLYSKENLTLDLISTENLTNSNIFFSKNILNNYYPFAISKQFYNSIVKLRKEEYAYIIKIGTNLKSELVYISFKSENKIRTPFKLANIFKPKKAYQKEYVTSKCIDIFSKLKEFKLTTPIQPEIIFNSGIYAKTYEMVNWFLKSSNKFSLSSYRFCFLYIKSLKEVENDQLFELMNALIENNIFTVPIFYDSKVPVESYLKLIPNNKQNLLISNFIQNNDNNHLFLFLKYSKFVITNDQSLKIACDQIQKNILYYSFEDKNRVTKEEFLIDLKFN